MHASGAGHCTVVHGSTPEMVLGSRHVRKVRADAAQPDVASTGIRKDTTSYATISKMGSCMVSKAYPIGSELHHQMHAGLVSASLPDSELDWLRPVYDVAGTASKVNPNWGSAGPWPHGIKLNITALKAAGVAEVWLEKLENGFDLALDAMPVFPVPPPNYSSLDDYGSLAQAKCDEYLKNGVLEEIPVHELNDPNSRFLFHPMGAVPKGLDDCRLIIDTSITLLNACIRGTIMKLHSYRVVLNACKPGYVIFGFDLTSGFHHLFVAHGMANLLCIITPDGRKCRFRYICFGLKIAPFLFQGFMMELRRVLIEIGVLPCFNSVYIDDWSMVASSVEAAEPIRAAFKGRMRGWNCVLNDEKEQAPSTVGEVTGVTIDTINLRIFICRKKCDKVVLALATFIQESEAVEIGNAGRVLKPAGYARLHEVDKVVGKLNNMAKVVQGGRLYLSPLWDAKARLDAEMRQSMRDKGTAVPSHVPYRRKALIGITTEIMEGLRWWERCLAKDEVPWRPTFVKPDGFLDIFDGKTFRSPWDIPAEHRGVSKLLVITTDASASGFGFVIGDPQRPAFKYAGMFSAEQSMCTSNFRESKTLLLAVLIVIKRLPELITDAFLVFRSDNTTAVSLINKGTSKSKPIRAIGKELFTTADKANVKLAAMHIPGRLNRVADGLSREAEHLYAARRLTAAAQNWLAAIMKSRGMLLSDITDVLRPLDGGLVPSNRLRRRKESSVSLVACSVPPPATTEACIKAAAYVRRVGYYAAILLPLSVEGALTHRWRPLLQRQGFVHIGSTPEKLVVFEFARMPCPDDSYGSRALELNVKPRLHLWLSHAPGCQRADTSCRIKQ